MFISVLTTLLFKMCNYSRIGSLQVWKREVIHQIANHFNYLHGPESDLTDHSLALFTWHQFFFFGDNLTWTLNFPKILSVCCKVLIIKTCNIKAVREQKVTHRFRENAQNGSSRASIHIQISWPFGPGGHHQRQVLNINLHTSTKLNNTIWAESWRADLAFKHERPRSWSRSPKLHENQENDFGPLR